MSDNQNSVSPKAFTEKIFSSKSSVINIKLQAKGLKKLKACQNFNTFAATMTSTLVTSVHIPQYNHPMVKPSDGSTNRVE